MIDWLTDTLVYTGLLIALVLVLRRPVARHFGAQAAYALWALPMLRFIMPPIVLPSTMAPEPVGEAATFVSIPLDAIAFTSAPAAETIAPTVAAQSGTSWGLFEIALDLAIPLWIAGALMFVGWRSWTYLKMREELLEDSRPVGESGKIRLVETPAVSAPVAFGVTDKVVALPMEFMALEDRHARDLAIEHELAHHRGWDLLANMLAQPVLALHWFNPIAWFGWRAMRRDQEAACDARVIAKRDYRERAAYGEVIASFAAGPRLALAAPMACPVLGEKSIIHRLRSLKMNDVSPRRRIAGRLMLGAAVLALPLTASISYAENQLEANVPPPAPVAPVPPVPPVPPVAPEAPEPPLAPDDHFAMAFGEGDEDVEVTVTREGDHEVTVIRKRVSDRVAPHDHSARVARQVRIHADAPHGDGEAHRVMRVTREGNGQNTFVMEFDDDDFDFDFDFDFEDMEDLVDLEEMNLHIQTISGDCDGDGPVENEVVSEDGRQFHRILICKQFAMNTARHALMQARESIEHNRVLTESIREEILQSLEEEIARLNEDG